MITQHLLSITRLFADDIFVLTYKIKNDMVPDYLNNLFPRVEIEQALYGLQHLSDFVNLPRRTVLFDNSCVRPAIHQWNSLPCHLRRSKISLTDCPLHFLHEDRVLISLHARMRNNYGNLKCDLFLNHLPDSNLCIYCNVPENADHNFFSVPSLLTNVYKCFTALAISTPSIVKLY